jgi:dephospho-CoA kinase
MRVGVTGIFASGKGTACAMFEKLGAVVVDADVIARDIMEPGRAGLLAVTREFGDSFLDTDGTLKRREFADFVFADHTRVKLLNEITHPIINEYMFARSDGSGIFMINAPLLFETGLDKSMFCNIVVFAEREQAIERGVLRDNISENEIKARLLHQIPLKEKRILADYVIDNSGSLKNTERQVVTIWNILKANKAM